MNKRLIIGASLGNCVHVAGVAHFLSMAEDEGYDSLFLGPAVPVDVILEKVRELQPDMVSLGYRLTPSNVIPLVLELSEKSKTLKKQPVWLFGGTRPVAKEVKKLGFFDIVLDSTEDIDDCIALLRNTSKGKVEEKPALTLKERIKQKYPYPLLRHHFGLPDYNETVSGCREIAESRVLDVISLGIDQNTQQFYFHPELKNKDMDGAGGVPVKSADEFRKLREAANCGNWPLMRCYSGTADIIELAEVLEKEICNAWCAVPLCWYNELDGRGTRPIEQSMTEAQSLMRWHAERGIPVEMNEPHHWGLRDAHDTISVAMAYIAALNAKKCGVKDYVAQYMFNIPNAMSFSMDLAKVLAQIELVELLSDDDFNIYRETRTGLPFLSGDTNVAKGQLASSTMLQMTVKPHIIHVVGYSEAEFAATPEVVIESCRIVRGVVRSVLHQAPDMSIDPVVQSRKRELLSEANYLIKFIRKAYSHLSEDPLTDPVVLSDCIRRGILDAPHIVKNERYFGMLQTRILDGKCMAVDPRNNTVLSERRRLMMLKEAGNLDRVTDSGVIPNYSLLEGTA